MRKQYENPYFKRMKKNPDINDGESISYSGITLKVIFFFVCTALGVMIFSFNLIPEGMKVPALIGGGIVVLAVPFLNYFKPQLTPFFGPIFCLAEGYYLGVICREYGDLYEGIIPIAIVVTLGVVLVMLFLYASRIIKPGRKFRAVVSTAFWLSILLGAGVYLSGFFTSSIIDFVTGNIVITVGGAIIMLIIAAMNIVVDFDNISEGIQKQYSSKYEWNLAFGLVVSIIFIFIRVLRILALIMGESSKE